MECPACGSTAIKDYINSNIPIFFLPVPSKMIKKVETKPIRLKICDNCAHIFQTGIDQKVMDFIYNELYENYNQDLSHTTTTVYEKRFLDLFGTKNFGKNLLDIGCGNGSLFPFFQRQGIKCYGIDPSKNAEKLKKTNPNVNVFIAPFEKNDCNVFDKKFDIIIMRNLLEHISEIGTFFKILNYYIKEGTEVYIEVPDLEYYIKNSIHLFYVHEHMQYFTLNTLKIMLERNGFEIIKYLSKDAPTIVIYGKYTGNKIKKDTKNPEENILKKEFVSVEKILRDKINNELKKYKKIILYGAGLTSFWVANFCLDGINKNNVELTDDNLHYNNKILPGLANKLKCKLENKNLTDSLVFITTSPVYYKKIKSEIPKRFGGDYKTAYIKENNLVVE